MHLKNFKIALIIACILLVVFVGYFSLTKKSSEPGIACTMEAKLCSDGSYVSRTGPNCEFSACPTTSVEYKNSEFGFNFSLPTSWSGYSIVNEKWEGILIGSPSSAKLEGPKILIRHPQWSLATPRQDIPIMVFKISEWKLITEEKLSVSAAPIGPSELGRNSQYVFALPARYNYAFPVGFEEVEEILSTKPLRSF